MVVADLHVHTTNSDGTLDVADIPAAATRADLRAVAITDHDRPHPDLDAPLTVIDGITVVHGIELRVEATDQRVDLLGYGLDPTDALREECERIQQNRANRGARIVQRVEDHLGIDLEVEARPGLGRPHIARAVAEHPAVEYDLQGVFDELIGDDRPCFVARDVPSFETGRRLLADACRIVGLAHPLRYDDPEAALALTAELDAVERWYPYDRPADPGDTPALEPVERAIKQYDLLPTGGSDAHGTSLGAAGLNADAWERVEAALDG
ncbi:PHP domain-containing protein [Salinarchaeum sp. Harcht-Bsk1]|uniref:PHP domain-containing protein n=1 Tax=Salinarchaeum sp. Harcht-Bsk1 TaxID=1333523 RepID=UPI000342385A|nr:PHP domain-containing protein [Salinarchaeum sp. Harcht-Bsk1]AGN00197.1 PHP domain-containing protein [Salinarchaeum sp. Harcht-Bsk1]